MAIKIKGVIGWDIIGTQFADMFSRLSGDITIEIDSPGGYVTDGISIFNAIKRYDKGKVHIVIVGECSSMAAYIMLAGDTLTFEPNAIVVLHNPWSGVCGDYRTFLHEANILQKMTTLYAGEFIKKGIFDEPTIRAAMDEERWFIGAEDLKLLGNVIERDLPKLEDVEKEARAAVAKDNIRAWQTKAKKGFKDDLSGAAALIAEMGFNNQTNIIAPTASGLITPAIGKQINKVTEIQNRKGNKIMDLKELETSHPDVYAEVFKLGKEQAQKEMKGLLAFIDDDKETVIQAINEGKTIRDDEVFAKLTRARMSANAIQAMEGSNPPQVNPIEPTPEPENPQAKAEAQRKAEEEQSKKRVAEILKYSE